MKSKALIAMAVAGVFWSAGSIANQSGMAPQSGVSTHQTAMTTNQWGMTTTGPSDANESSFGLSTLTSADTRTGGYKGWGPMANFMGPASVDESQPLAQIDEEREHKRHVAEVTGYRDQVWVANAPLRSEYDNVGATRSEGRGFGRFFGR